jgi:glycine cleavage system H protein
VVESVKAASDIYAPIAGEVVAFNDQLNDAPELVNADPYSTWIFKLKPINPDDLANLLEATQYQTVAEES